MCVPGVVTQGMTVLFAFEEAIGFMLGGMYKVGGQRHVGIQRPGPVVQKCRVS